MPLQFKNIAVGNLQDDVSGNNYAANKAVYILNLNNTLAQIYSDEAGTIPIIQDGVNNVTGAKGVFGFWVEAGDYFVQVGANKYRVSITGADYFNNRVDETVNLIVDSVAGRGAYYVVGSFESGFTYTDINQVGTFGGTDYYVYTGGLTNLPHNVTAGTNPTLNSGYAQVFYGEIDNITDIRKLDESYKRTYQSLNALLADSANLVVGRNYETESYHQTIAADQYSLARGGNTYKLVDSGSAGNRPTEDGGSVIHIAGGSGGLWLKGLFEDGVVWAEQFGAKADYDRVTGAGTDNEPAISAAIAYHRDRVDINSGFFKVNKSINASKLFAGGRLVGRHGSKISGAYQGTIIFGNTGEYPILDTIGSQRYDIEGVAFVTATNADNPSKCGIYHARSTDSPYAQFNTLHNVTVDIDSDPTAYGGKGTVGICNIASEIYSTYDVYSLGDTGYHQASDNSYYSIPSHYGTQGGPPSNSTVKFVGNTNFNSKHYVGNPIRLLACVEVTGEIYVFGASGTGGAGDLSGGLYIDGITKLVDLQVFTENCDFPATLGSGIQNCKLEFSGSYSENYYIRKVNQTTAWACNSLELEFSQTVDGSYTPPQNWIVLNTGDTVNNLSIKAPAKGSSTAGVAGISGWIGITNGSILNVDNLSLSTDSYKEIGATRAVLDGKGAEAALTVSGLYMWRNGDTLVLKPSAPSSDSDFTFAMYKTANYPFGGGSSAGNYGDIARSGNTLAFYTGDGVTHSWGTIDLTPLP